jgi:hypothetical protein
VYEVKEGRIQRAHGYALMDELHKMGWPTTNGTLFRSGNLVKGFVIQRHTQRSATPAMISQRCPPPTQLQTGPGPVVLKTRRGGEKCH